MAFLVIAGIEVEVTRFRERPRVFRGEAVRSFNNTLMDGTDAGKGEWDAETYPLAATAVDALRAAIGSGSVLCTGAAFRDAAHLCKVTIEDAPYGPDVQGGAEDWTDFNQTLALLLREV